MAYVQTVHWPKFRMERVDENNAIFNDNQGDVSVWIIKLCYIHRYKPNQASKMDLFANKVKGFELTLQTLFE